MAAIELGRLPRVLAGPDELRSVITASQTAGRRIALIAGLHPNPANLFLRDFRGLDHLTETLPLASHTTFIGLFPESAAITPAGVSPPNLTLFRGDIATVRAAVRNRFASDVVSFGCHLSQTFHRPEIMEMRALLLERGGLTLYLFGKSRRAEGAADMNKNELLARRIQFCGFENVTLTALAPEENPLPRWPHVMETLLTAVMRPSPFPLIAPHDPFVIGLKAALGEDADPWVVALAANFLRTNFPRRLQEEGDYHGIEVFGRGFLPEVPELKDLTDEISARARDAINRLRGLFHGRGTIAQRAGCVRGFVAEYFLRHQPPYSGDGLWHWIGWIVDGTPGTLKGAHRGDVVDLLWAHATEWDGPSQLALERMRAPDAETLAAMGLPPPEALLPALAAEHVHIMTPRASPPAVDEDNLFVKGLKAAAGGELDAWVLAIAAEHLNRDFPGDQLLPPPLLRSKSAQKIPAVTRSLLGVEAERKSLVEYLSRHATEAIERLHRVVQGRGPTSQRAVFIRALAEDYFTRFPAPHSYERLWLWIGAVSGGRADKLEAVHRDDLLDLVWAHASEWDVASRPYLRMRRLHILSARAGVEGPVLPEIPATPDEVIPAVERLLVAAADGSVTPRDLWHQLRVTLHLEDKNPPPEYADHVLIAMWRHKDKLGKQTRLDLVRTMRERGEALRALGFEPPPNPPPPPPPAPREPRSPHAASSRPVRPVDDKPDAMAQLRNALIAVLVATKRSPFMSDEVVAGGPLSVRSTLPKLCEELGKQGITTNPDSLLSLLRFQFNGLVWRAIQLGILEERFATAYRIGPPVDIARAPSPAVAPPLEPQAPPPAAPRTPEPPPPLHGQVTKESLARFLGLDETDPRIQDVKL